MSDFNKLFSLLKEKTGLVESDLARRIEEKKGSLGHLVNDDVALRLVAKDLGVSLYDDHVEKPTVKLEDLIPGLGNINILVRVVNTGEIKEFTRRDGAPGRVARVKVSDETGLATLVLWDENTKMVPNLIQGTTISVRSAYSKQGFDGVEVHVGQKGSVEIISKTNNSIKGTISRVYDPIDFNHRDGRRGRVVAFLVRNGGYTKVLIWNPSDEVLSSLKEGVTVEITGGGKRRGLNGEIEVHVNNENAIKFGAGEDSDIVPMRTTRLSEIKGEETDLVVEGVIESELELFTTQSGKQYVKALIRDREAVLPIIFWNDKAEKIMRIAKRGACIRVEGCSSRFSPKGIEIVANRWCKITTR